MTQRNIRRMAWGLVLVMFCLPLTGCGRKRSSLLMERRARGPFELERQFGARQVVYLHPPTRTIKQDGVEVTARFASMKDLQQYFQNAEIFGKDAGTNPFQSENIVFYVRIANTSAKRILLDPDQFVLVDDMGVQYSYLSPDYLNALAEARVSVGEATRMGLGKAPSVYGVDVGGFASGLVPKSQKRLALLKQVSLNKSVLFPSVVYDGYISFIRPHKDAKHLRLIVGNVKTDFDANDEPRRVIDFPFDFDVTQAIVATPPDADEAETDDQAPAAEPAPPAVVAPASEDTKPAKK